MPLTWTRLALGLGAVALTGVGWSAWRIYRFESAFYRPARRTLAVPRTLPRAAEAFVGAPGGMRLAAWYQPPVPPRRTVVLLGHGSGADRAQLLPQAELLSRAGYGVLLLDWPGHGSSGGTVAFGRAEISAVRTWADWLGARPEVDAERLAALGCSAGAFLLLAASAEEPRLAAVVAEAPATTLDAVVRAQYGRRPWGAWAARLAARRAGADLDALSALEAVRRPARAALLLVAGERDTVTRPEMARELAAAAGPRAELWSVPGAGHCQALETAPAEYRRRLLAFLARALGTPDPPD